MAVVVGWGEGLVVDFGWDTKIDCTVRVGRRPVGVGSGMKLGDSRGKGLVGMVVVLRNIAVVVDFQGR